MVFLPAAAQDSNLAQKASTPDQLLDNLQGGTLSTKIRGGAAGKSEKAPCPDVKQQTSCFLSHMFGTTRSRV